MRRLFQMFFKKVGGKVWHPFAANERGSILVVTLGFIMVFTMMGTAAIFHAGQENQVTEKRQQSMQAFWLAEAGLEKAKNRLKNVNPVTISQNFSLGSGNVNVYSTQDPACLSCEDRWLVHSEGLVKNQLRRVEAVVARYDIKDVLTAEGPIKDFANCPMASLSVDCSLVKQNVDFSLETILNGLTQAELVSHASYTYINPKNSGDINPIADVTVVYLSGNNSSLSLNTDNQTDSSFLFIDTTLVSGGSTPSINIAGNGDFSGIIWIKGAAEIKGTTTIRGSIFVESGSTTQTKALGNATLIFDPDAIDEAINAIGSPTLDIPDIISWKEI